MVGPWERRRREVEVDWSLTLENVHVRLFGNAARRRVRLFAGLLNSLLYHRSVMYFLSTVYSLLFHVSKFWVSYLN